MEHAQHIVPTERFQLFVTDVHARLGLVVGREQVPGLDELYRNATFDGTAFQALDVEVECRWGLDDRSGLRLLVLAKTTNCRFDVRLDGKDPLVRKLGGALLRLERMRTPVTIVLFPSDGDLERALVTHDSGDLALAQSLGWAVATDLGLRPWRVLLGVD